MSILKITKKEDCGENPQVNELEYGTFITDVPSGNDCIYVKVEKKEESRACSSNRALIIKWQSGYCVLLNLTYGTLRQIPGKTRVTPLQPCLTVAPLARRRHQEVKRNGFSS